VRYRLRASLARLNRGRVFPRRSGAEGTLPPGTSRGARRTRAQRAGLWARILGLLLAFCGSVAFGYFRQIPAPSALAADPAPPPAGDPRIALFHAADQLQGRLATGGGGLEFTATQIQLLRRDPNGPDLLLQPDRQNPDRPPVAVEQIVLGSLSGRGSAKEDSFFAEWFNGTDPQGLPAFDGDVAYTGLVVDGELWRRDERSDDAGLGWIAAPDIPGFGVDPASIRELPHLLRNLQGATYLGVDPDGRHWSGISDALWYPGAVAIDGASFTGPQVSIEFWLDDSDRLVGLFAVARNINETTYQLLCVDRIRFQFSATPAPVPSDPG